MREVLPAAHARRPRLDYEAASSDVEALGLERVHRTLVSTRKDGKVVTTPLAPRTARAIDLAIGERCQGLLRSRPGSRSGDSIARGGSRV
jgi:integrase/recombinase XerD